MSTNLILPRRSFLKTLTVGSAALFVPGVFAEELVRTPSQTEGPFYPDKLPLDTDNDLLIINETITPAVGTVTHLTGRILDSGGKPVRSALVEIWQVDNNGTYLHSRSANRGKLDKNFQGFGRFLTNAKGQYYFRTIKPVPYPGRTPHIHFAVKIKGKKVFTTQCYIKGSELNKRDFILQAIRDKKARESLIVDFKPIKKSRLKEVSANFDIVLGFTPEG